MTAACLLAAHIRKERNKEGRGEGVLEELFISPRAAILFLFSIMRHRSHRAGAGAGGKDPGWGSSSFFWRGGIKCRWQTPLPPKRSAVHGVPSVDVVLWVLGGVVGWGGVGRKGREGGEKEEEEQEEAEEGRGVRREEKLAAENPNGRKGAGRRPPLWLCRSPGADDATGS